MLKATVKTGGRWPSVFCCLVLYGSLWCSMALYGALWRSMVPHSITLHALYNITDIRGIAAVPTPGSSL